MRSMPDMASKRVNRIKRFLDAQAFIELVLQPYRDANFQPHAGPFLFEFQRHGLPAG